MKSSLKLWCNFFFIISNFQREVSLHSFSTSKKPHRTLNITLFSFFSTLSKGQIYYFCGSTWHQKLINDNENTSSKILKSASLLELDKKITFQTSHKMPSQTWHNYIKVHITFSFNSDLKTLAPNSISSQGNTLKHLVLSKNHLSEVPTAAIKHLKNLEHLNLNENLITVLRNEAFSGLSKVSLDTTENETILVQMNIVDKIWGNYSWKNTYVTLLVTFIYWFCPFYLA